jgi:hypothetical protein
MGASNKVVLVVPASGPGPDPEPQVNCSFLGSNPVFGDNTTWNKFAKCKTQVSKAGTLEIIAKMDVTLGPTDDPQKDPHEQAWIRISTDSGDVIGTTGTNEIQFLNNRGTNTRKTEVRGSYNTDQAGPIIYFLEVRARGETRVSINDLITTAHLK